MNWIIPDLDPYIIYAWKEIVRWTMANVTAIALIMALLSWLKVQALKTKNVLDDKIVTLLIYVFSFSWLPGIQQRAELERKEGDQSMKSKNGINLTMLLAVLALLIIPSAPSFAAGTASTPSVVSIGNMMKIVSVTYKGDASDGSVPAVTLSAAIMADLKGYYLYTVRAYPVSGGTAPDAANVAVKNARKDYLGNQGVGLIPASGENEVLPHNTFNDKDYYPAIVDQLTIEVTGQDTPDADFIVELIAVR